MATIQHRPRRASSSRSAVFPAFARGGGGRITVSADRWTAWVLSLWGRGLSVGTGIWAMHSSACWRSCYHAGDRSLLNHPGVAVPAVSAVAVALHHHEPETITWWRLQLVSLAWRSRWHHALHRMARHGRSSCTTGRGCSRCHVVPTCCPWWRSTCGSWEPSTPLLWHRVSVPR